MMVVVPTLSRGEQGDKRQIRCCIVEIAFAECVIRAVNYRIQENVRGGLDEVRNSSPNRPEQQHENCDTRDYASEPEAENMAVEPAIANVRCERRQRLRLLRFARIVVNVAEQNPPKAFEHRTVRIALDVRVAMMFAVHRDPFFRVDTRPQPQLQAHRKRDDGAQVNAAMRERSM